jgi:hypothetical protein
MLDDDGVVYCIIALASPEIYSKLQNPICQQHFVSVLEILKKITISDRLKHALDSLLAAPAKAVQVLHSREFRDLTSAFIEWGK